MHYSFLAAVAIFISLVPASGQNTIGLLRFDVEKTAPGYNLIFPHNQSTVYLLDNCGRVVQTWEDELDIRPGNVVELRPDGTLIKCKRPNASIHDPIWAGGGGATVELRSWDNDLLASFTLNNEDFRLHHDIASLPNGNILMIAWAKKSRAEAIAAGRDTALLPQDEVWSETVLEWDPEADSIVWEWHVWDHLVQDYDPTKANFGTVADHPELIDINYDEHDGHPDWLHINAIDYNPVLDQIVLSVPYFNEIWVIDHSTTTEEAASHTGGRSGKGGDLLYRWGNPAAYQRGTDGDKKLFFQHDIHWPYSDAQPGKPGFGLLAVFNNRVDPVTSPAHTFATPFDTTTWTYTLNDDTFEPSGFAETRAHPEMPVQSLSSGLSSVQVLENGNWLICSGRWGFSYEVTNENELVWEYITPIKFGAPAVQGDTSFRINNNLTFRMDRYAPDFPGFAGKDLTPEGYLELEPNEGFCSLAVSTKEPVKTVDWQLFPNPATDRITLVHSDLPAKTSVTVSDLSGRILLRRTVNSSHTELNMESLAPGLYIVRMGRHAQKVIVR